jgi:hypothetical protein
LQKPLFLRKIRLITSGRDSDSRHQNKEKDYRYQKVKGAAIAFLASQFDKTPGYAPPEMNW